MKDDRAMNPNKFLFRQVYDHIVTRIERGEWKAHDKLPSIRLLAQEYHVHRLTAFRAFQILKQQGKAYVKEKSGYYVSPGCLLQVPSEQIKGRDGPFFSHMKNDLSEIQEISVDYQLSQALIDPNLLPNLFLSEYVKKVFDAYPKLIGTYSSVQGDSELREVLCRYLVNRHRFQISAREVLITTGATQAIHLLSSLYIKHMDAILVERPTYSAAI
ncbi:MAG: GntR family transcriptional regulator, partial [Cohnella sp.]|nr:GntR family transcriptional regulator [Cohnella sp.]